jgi:F0F1-type ATP synthase membrane subunit c/vacuolar-type H+-ATPase subunit K
MAISDERQAQGFGPTTTRDDVRAALQPVVQSLQIVVGALPLGVLSFLGVVLYTHSNATHVAAEADLSTARLLSINTALVTLGAWAARGVVGQRVLSGEALRETGPQAVRSWCIVRAALAEAPALVGLVVCLLGATSGAMRADPLLWLNTLPLVLQLAATAATFPTLDSLTDRAWARLHDGT